MSQSAQQMHIPHKQRRLANAFLHNLAIFWKLLFPLRVVRWVVSFSLVYSLVAPVLGTLLGVEWITALGIAGVVMSLFVSLLIMPMQAIALASCRPFGLLGNSRRWLLLVIIATAFMFGMASYWALGALPKVSLAPSILVLWLMVSLWLQVSIWLCSRWQGMHGFIFVLNAFFADIYSWLNESHPIGLLSTLIASWIIFSYWWLHWMPAKYRSNNMLLPNGELHRQQMEAFSASRWMAGGARSWVGARLLGYSDSWSALVKRILFTLVLVRIAPVPLFMFMEMEKIVALLQVGTVIFLMVAAGGVAQGTAANLFRNLRSSWLCSAGSHTDLFSLTWRVFFREVGPWSLVMVLLAVMLELISGGWRGYQTWGIFLLSISLQQILVFLLVLFIYQRKAASIFWCNWICTLIFLVWLYSVCATGLLFPLPFDWQGISTLWVWLPELFGIAVLYPKVRQGFSTMNFLRAA